MSSTAGGGSTQQTAERSGDRLGFKPGMVVQELGWDNDTDDELRVAIEDRIDADMVDGDYGNVVDAVLLWWRDDDGDLVDGLVDSLTDLVGGGAIWLLTPKVGRPNAVDAADIAEAAPIAGLSQTTTAAVSKDWSATRLVAPKTPARDPSRPTATAVLRRLAARAARRRARDGCRCSAESGRRSGPTRRATPGPDRPGAHATGAPGPAGGFTALALREPDQVGARRRARRR